MIKDSRTDKDKLEIEVDKLQGQLQSQKATFEVTSKDLDISYKVLAGAQSLLSKCPDCGSPGEGET